MGCQSCDLRRIYKLFEEKKKREEEARKRALEMKTVSEPEHEEVVCVEPKIEIIEEAEEIEEDIDLELEEKEIEEEDLEEKEIEKEIEEEE